MKVEALLAFNVLAFSTYNPATCGRAIALHGPTAPHGVFALSSTGLPHAVMQLCCIALPAAPYRVLALSPACLPHAVLQLCS